MINIGERLQYIRETYDITQEELGNFLNLSKSSISHYEKNDRDIPLRKLSKISDFFDLSIDYMLDLSKIKKYPNQRKEIDLKLTGSRLTELCKDQQFTNVKLASILNTTESNIRKYRTGKTLLLTAFALELSMKYNYSIDWLAGKADVKLLTSEKKKEKIKA